MKHLRESLSLLSSPNASLPKENSFQKSFLFLRIYDKSPKKIITSVCRLENLALIFFFFCFVSKENFSFSFFLFPFFYHFPHIFLLLKSKKKKRRKKNCLPEKVKKSCACKQYFCKFFSTSSLLFCKFRVTFSPQFFSLLPTE